MTNEGKGHAQTRAMKITLMKENVLNDFNISHIICEKYLKHQQDLYHVFIDFKKAFDRVWHANLWAIMKKYNINHNPKLGN